MGLRARAKDLVRVAFRPVTPRLRKVLVRLLRPLIARVDVRLQLLFDRQQADRARLVRLEQQVAALQRQVSAQQSRAA
ncbi:hypothetical protein J8F10_32320 [Gemmata sp. G18]|uniref:Ubiquinone biosynthesis accessory factor UbiK n=1 Tax=Gemmata palustris TaxID=2822762 RepID=A0ABS5C2Q3_9BACT|nr:hypothetical protein [Gemmata palustris]MBP3959952.1 hypothetical protein [Gemmata palustris]